MKVALLTAKPNWRGRVDGHRFSVAEKRMPHGIGFLYAVLKQAGFDVDVFDRYCGDTRWPRDGWASYDFLGLYTTTICSKDIDRILRKARARRIAVGGPHAHLFPERIPGNVDHIVQGEAENIIVDLVQGRIDQRIVVPDRLSSGDLDALPRYPYELFYREHHDLYDWSFIFHPARPMFTMNTSRGCPFDCSFCSVKRIWGRKLTAMSVDRVLRDIEYIQSLGARAIYFREDNFTTNRSRLLEMCERLIRIDSGVVWACETRVDSLDPEVMTLMRRAGCVGLYTGVEHLSQRMLDILNKKITVEQIIEFFDNARARGIFTHAAFITEHPQETDADRRESRRLLEVIRPDAVTTNRYREEG